MTIGQSRVVTDPSADFDRALAAVAAIQLAAGLAGQLIALRRKLPYDVAVIRLQGRPENVARDSWHLGTALSAPVAMLATQAWATAQLRRSAGSPAREIPRRLLGALGAAMVGGYLGERVVRHRLQRKNWDAVETPTVVVGLTLAALMAALATRGQRASGLLPG